MLIEPSASGNTIAGADGAANLISGNGVIGVYINGPGTSGNIVEGNFIGTDVSGAVALPNVKFGVLINSAASGNTIGGTSAGAKNVISGNGIYGIMITDHEATNNRVAGNLIDTAAGKGGAGSDISNIGSWPFPHPHTRAGKGVKGGKGVRSRYK